MQTNLEVLFAPAEFDALAQRDLSGTVCVVFDVLRATSSMVTALHNGASAIIPVSEIPHALKLRERDPNILLAGERDGVLIGSDQTGTIPFDLGNSPREFTREKVGGKILAITTTNGTRALRACATAKRIFASSFLNLQATAECLAGSPDILLVCSGTFEQMAYEDVLAAGALCDLLSATHGSGAVADSALIARTLYLNAKSDLPAALSQSRNGQRLLTKPDLKDDVAFCARRDVFPLVAEMGPDGSLKRRARD